MHLCRASKLVSSHVVLDCSVCSKTDQQFDTAWLALISGDMQRRAAFGIPGVHMSSSSQQVADALLLLSSHSAVYSTAIETVSTQ